ncbi:hypothetical protein MesoLj113a_44910 [Mesorhizobium sp. 113-1-2]|uniref:SH3 domain-containing protein n=1 Tax=Mesorhizobium sp. 113-1-2 TaxID=2744515 RepID=UPI0008199D6E|nr:SH3 domain-containing protein [Mesorhizobium sp. 113-1-2]BAV45422.1 Uncharacterized protein MLTONO_0519 [Mesorhizobium loti]BCG73333.1 hypothetical protein MesoLj113a_44910 [Mesorhizobium sp. 113-1-2]
MPSADDIGWFKQQFATQITAAVSGTPFDVDMITAIACQETGSIWSVLRKANLSIDRIAALCVGDTIDYKGPHKGRQAFPLNKADLLSKPRGGEMFTIARAALEDMAAYVPGYEGAVAKAEKFCHGYGVFQRDLQFFLEDPDYFLDKKYELFSNTLDHCLKELARGLKTIGLEARKSISDYEFACVAIAYNTGGFKASKGLKQGYFDGTKYYGEYIADYLALSRSVESEPPAITPGPYVVIARGGLKLRGGPGTEFQALQTLPANTTLQVVAIAGPDNNWAQVDLENDGLLDGYVFGAFIVPAASHPNSTEMVIEPG